MEPNSAYAIGSPIVMTATNLTMNINQYGSGTHMMAITVFCALLG